MATATDEQVNISTLDFWRKPWEERMEAFRWLRNNEPVRWCEAPEPLDPGLPPEDGFWSITKYEDCRELSRKAKIFSSAEGVFMDEIPALEDFLSFIVMDAPRHTALRGIVQSVFSPGHMRTMEGWIRDHVVGVVDDVAPMGEAELCSVMFAQLPGRVFCEFAGVVEPERQELMMSASEQLGSWTDPKYTDQGMTPLEVFQDAGLKLMLLAVEEFEKRRTEPQDDMMTWIIEAEVDGEKMSEGEICAFFALLSGAANDTTRHAMGHAVRVLQDHPEQKALLLEDFDNRIEGAVEELLRYQPPLMHFARFATEDYELRGQTIKKGQKVVLWYHSGNRDEEVWENPDTFDITRHPNRHLSFGAGGAHYCMGSALGRLMMKHALKEIYTRMPDLEVGEPKLQLSNFMNGVKEINGTWTPEQKG